MSVFDEYLSRPGAKPMWQIAYESGCGSVEYLHQIARGKRRANPAQAVGIELSTGGVVSRHHLRPQDSEVIWGTARAVHERMARVQIERKAVYASYVSSEKQERQAK